MSGSDEEARAERLAAALRENLKRRKQQARGRQAGEATDEGRGEAAPTPPAVPSPGGEKP